MDYSTLTLESLNAAMRDFEIEQDARDLDIFLSDKWHFYRIIRGGGSIVQVGDAVYAVEKPKDLLSWFNESEI